MTTHQQGVEDLKKLERIELDDAPSRKDKLAKKEEIAYETSPQDFKEDLMKAQVDNLRQDMELRRTYSDRLFQILLGWLVFVGGMVVGAGTNLEIEILGTQVSFELSDTVLSVLLGTTTLNVIGLFLVVARYIFPQPKS